MTFKKLKDIKKKKPEQEATQIALHSIKNFIGLLSSECSASKRVSNSLSFSWSALDQFTETMLHYLCYFLVRERRLASIFF